MSSPVVAVHAGPVVVLAYAADTVSLARAVMDWMFFSLQMLPRKRPFPMIRAPHSRSLSWPI